MVGDPGSPAFRFMMDLREDCGDEAGEDASDHAHSRNMMQLKKVRIMNRVQSNYLF